MKKNLLRCLSSTLSKRIALLVCCTVLLFGCSTKTAYHFLDWGIKWYIGKYISLTHEQKEFTEKALDDFHDWHRRSQLVPYAEFIEALREKLNSGEITGEQLHAEVDQIQLMIDISVDQLLPLFINLTASLSDEQVEELMENLAEKREEYEKDHVTASREKVIEARINDLQDHLSPHFGRLTDEQKQWLEDWATSLIPFEEVTLKQQEIWAEDVKALLAKRQDKAMLKRELRKLIVTNTDDWPEDAQAIFDKNQELTYDFLARLVNNLTPKQKKKMNSKFDSYINDLYDLAKHDEQEKQ